jgi:SanA protein
MIRFIKRNFRRAFKIGLLFFAVCAGINLYIYLYSYKYIQSDSVPARQSAIVLGARVHSHGKLSDVFQDRLLTAEELLKNKNVSDIIISGDNRQSHNNETSRGSTFLVKRGIPLKNIFTDNAGYTTYDTMARAKKYYGVNEAVIVTQKYHLYRALYIARKKGIDAVGVPADRQGYRDIKFYRFREFFANIKAFIQVAIDAEPAVTSKNSAD